MRNQILINSTVRYLLVNSKSACLSVCMSICLYVCTSVHLYVCMFVRLPVILGIFMNNKYIFSISYSRRLDCWSGTCRPSSQKCLYLSRRSHRTKQWSNSSVRTAWSSRSETSLSDLITKSGFWRQCLAMLCALRCTRERGWSWTCWTCCPWRKWTCPTTSSRTISSLLTTLLKF